jgi:hypothetical protein
MSGHLYFFLGGIIQGSRRDREVHDQDYRHVIRGVLSDAFPGSKIFCPVENHPDSPTYSDRRARDVFFHHLKILGRSDCLVAYLPEASMGTSIEMWHSFHRNIFVVAITPMRDNWIVRLFSHKVCSGLDAFREYARSGDFQNMLESHMSELRQKISC